MAKNWIDTSGTDSERQERIVQLHRRANELQQELDGVCDEIEALERSLGSIMGSWRKTAGKAEERGGENDS